MSSFLVAFVCAVIMAIIVITFIAYCMFCKERHKSERFQYDIADLRQQNIEIAQEKDLEKQKSANVTAGVFILSRKSRKEDYSYHKRPDYPEGPLTPVEPSPEKLIEILNDPSTPETRKCVEFDDVPYHSEV